MSLVKRDIINNISNKALISSSNSYKLFELFVDLIKKESSSKLVKIANFGTFYLKKSPSRVGRNPKTKKEFLISERSKLILKTSNSIKKILN